MYTKNFSTCVQHHMYMYKHDKVCVHLTNIIVFSDLYESLG